jgi:glucokinase
MPDSTAIPPAVVLVNGLPGAGKTTLGRALSRRLRLPLFSKDVIKEAHAGVLGAQPPGDQAQRDWSAALGAAASDTLWALLADAPGGAVVESCWPASYRQFAIDGLARAGIESAPLEIWCQVPVTVARCRFEQRHPRHPIHGELLSDQEWERWRHGARPLRLGAVLSVDTTRPVDLHAITAWISSQI